MLQASGEFLHLHHVTVKRFRCHVGKYRIESQIICFQAAELKHRFLYSSVRYIVKKRKIKIRYHRATVGNRHYTEFTFHRSSNRIPVVFKKLTVWKNRTVIEKPRWMKHPVDPIFKDRVESQVVARSDKQHNVTVVQALLIV